ncbi:hypothetical protein SAMN04487975_108161 [Planococcus glaciei]|nr:hypothetical protein SAMN04487975_108161 [Planococcus glaciei]
MTNLKYFLYLYFLNSIFFLCIVYMTENFQESFTNLNAADIVSGIVIFLILLSYTWLLRDPPSKYDEFGERTKNLYFFGSLFTAIVTMMFLISI